MARALDEKKKKLNSERLLNFKIKQFTNSFASKFGRNSVQQCACCQINPVRQIPCSKTSLHRLYRPRNRHSAQCCKLLPSLDRECHQQEGDARQLQKPESN